MPLKLASVTCCHGRPAITRAFARHTASLGIDHRIAVLSHAGQDPSAEDTAAYLHDLGFTVLFNDNMPLGDKHNAAMYAAMHTDADAFIILPSDDFAHPKWIDYIRQGEHPYTFPPRLAMVDLPSGEACVISARTTGSIPFGAGRAIHRTIIDRMGGTPLFPPNARSGLDSASHGLLRHYASLHLPKLDYIAITDVKTPGNIWPYRTWTSHSTKITPEEALSHVTDAHDILAIRDPNAY